MKVEIKVPLMGESVTEATVATFLKPEGSQVKADDELLELETAKVNQVLYAPDDGIVNYNVKTDDVVQIGQVIGHINTTAGVKAEKHADIHSLKHETAKKSETKMEQKTESGARLTKEHFLSELAFPEPVSGEPHIFPPQTVSTSKAHFKEPIQPKSNKLEKRETRRRMTSIRKVIAARMVQAQQTTAMLTTFNEIDMSQVISLRERYKESFNKEHGVKLGFMSFFVKACVAALEEIPDLNSYIDGDEIVHREYYDIGIAVGTDRGIVVPVVRDCDKLSFAGIEKAIEGFAAKARDGTISADDLTGGGFTITNGGVYGSLLSTPILNPPQSGILGMHKISKRAVVVDDQIVIRPMMYVALSYDHRIVDGKEAVSFLVNLKNNLEDPARLLLGL